MKKFKISRSALFLAAFLFVLVLSLVLYGLSFEVYSDEYGTDISVNEDYLTLAIMALIATLTSVYALVCDCKGIEVKKEYLTICAGTTCAVGSFYCLKVFLKAYFKAVAKGNAFDFAAKSIYLYFFIFLLLLLAGFVLSYFANKKESTNK